MLLPAVIVAQNLVIVQGSIRNVDTSEPISGVNIVVNFISIAQTDLDGKFMIRVERDAELSLYAVGYEDRVVNLDNRQELNIFMEPQVVQIDAVEVVSEVKSKVIAPEPTEIIIKQNYFCLKTRFRLYDHLFHSEDRFIFQPCVYNQTRKTIHNLRPLVVDGKYFKINNERLNDGEMDRDKLYEFVIEQNIDKENNLYTYSDSTYIDSKYLNDDFHAECYLAINQLDIHPKDYLDTMVIARGTKNPLRFLEYSFDPLPLVDSSLIPRPEFKLMSDIGSSQISFMIGKAQIDESNPNNVRELEMINKRINDILGNEYASVRSIAITGYASPEGGYALNYSLATQRTKMISDRIKASIDPSYDLELIDNSVVMKWSALIPLLEEDEEYEIAEQIAKIVMQYKDDYDRCSYAIRRLSSYRSLIVPTYLPRLRRVEYVIDYSIFRNLRDDEIWARYNSKAEDISRFEYWRLIESAPTEEQRVELEEQAHSLFRGFDLISNRVAVRSIVKGEYDSQILESCMDKDVPFEILYNQTLMALYNIDIEGADSLSSLLIDDYRSEDLKAIIEVHKGQFKEVPEPIKARGGLNEILVLLHLERNLEALERIVPMMEEPENQDYAKGWYVLAVCYNRTENLLMAMQALTMATALDPDLEMTARIDSDMIDIIELIAPSDDSMNYTY